MYKVKRIEKRKKEDRKKLFELSVRLLNIQIGIISKNQKTDEICYEIEIAKYLKDYVLSCMVYGQYSEFGKRAMHGAVVKKYPEPFQIFDKS